MKSILRDIIVIALASMPAVSHGQEWEAQGKLAR